MIAFLLSDPGGIRTDVLKPFVYATLPCLYIFCWPICRPLLNRIWL